MDTNHKHDSDLPVKGDLTIIYAFSCVIVILMGGASLGGFLFRDTIYPTDMLLESFLPTDLAILVTGLPFLIISMWLTWRGKLIGLLLWPGTLFYALYNYLVYVLAMPLNAGYLLHLALVMLVAYTLIALLAKIDAGDVQERLGGAVPERLSGGVLAGLGTLFTLRAFGVVVSALINGEGMATTELALNTVDFIISPAWVICGVLLWKRRAFGYETGLGLLFQASMLFIGLIILMIFQPTLTGVPFALLDVAIVFALGLVCFIPTILFGRGVVSVGNN